MKHNATRGRDYHLQCSATRWAESAMQRNVLDFLDSAFFIFFHVFCMEEISQKQTYRLRDVFTLGSDVKGFKYAI